MTALSLSVDAFVRSFAINRRTPHALFLGAGASVSSGVPSAQLCMWEWKRSIFLTKNPGLEMQFREITLRSVQNKIQHWLDTQGVYPPAGAPTEYGFYIEACFPIPADRRRYFQEKVQQARPRQGYQLLCALVEVGAVASVWTTNFDGLVARAAAGFNITPIEVGIDSTHRAVRMSSAGELLCVSLHGDYRYDSLKNTADELREQDAGLRRSLVTHVSDRPLVVCGYSGRDVSVMSALTDAYRVPGPGSLYWCGYQGVDIPESVRDLLYVARAAGRTAFYVESGSFDDLMRRLALHSVDGAPADRVRAIAAVGGNGVEVPKAPFEVPDLPLAHLIKSNAFEMSCPLEVYAFDLKAWPAEKVWAWMDDVTVGRDVVAVPFRGKVLALGTLTDIKAAFGERVKDNIERVPVNDQDLSVQDGPVSSLMRRALVRSIASSRDLRTDGRAVLWVKRPSKTVDGFHVFDSAVVTLRQVGARLCLIVKPSIRIEDEMGREAPEERSLRIKLDVLGYQHNRQFNDVINEWRERLFVGSVAQFEFPAGVASPFRFEVKRAPLLAAIGAREGGLPEKVRSSGQQRGMLLAEPSLVFADKRTGNSVRDTYHLRGLVENRPYDFSITRTGLAGPIRVGVVCPKREEGLAAKYLQQFYGRILPGRYEADYLREYPGFERVFGVAVEVPSPGSAAWSNYAEPTPEASGPGGVSALAQAILRSIDALHAANAPNVVFVFVPKRFERWERFESDDERVDLHDQVKAYCVLKGVATQFLREATVTKREQCRIWWWLSIATYAKAMRTPWVLESLDSDTAFAGLGYSLDPTAPRGKHVVLGCSHIYNTRGEGLQYRLTKVEDPILRNGNCFLSEPDACRVGETVRELFFEQRFRVPGRVVIHKRTPFLKSEIAGLRHGLEGVSEIDLVEICEDDTLRFVASEFRRDGTFTGHSYPVERGTVVQLAQHEALLWVHGSSRAVNAQRIYYQGKRRIPAPLLLRRHAGSSDLNKLASEILGLSKMNWNSGDFYAKQPSTVLSSGQIARIGSLLDRFGAVPYDYRLFI